MKNPTNRIRRKSNGDGGTPQSETPASAAGPTAIKRRRQWLLDQSSNEEIVAFIMGFLQNPAAVPTFLDFFESLPRELKDRIARPLCAVVPNTAPAALPAPVADARGEAVDGTLHDCLQELSHVNRRSKVFLTCLRALRHLDHTEGDPSDSEFDDLDMGIMLISGDIVARGEKLVESAFAAMRAARAEQGRAS